MKNFLCLLSARSVARNFFLVFVKYPPVIVKEVIRNYIGQKLLFLLEFNGLSSDNI